jgi:hypothetical protein
MQMERDILKILTIIAQLPHLQATSHLSEARPVYLICLLLAMSAVTYKLWRQHTERPAVWHAQNATPAGTTLYVHDCTITAYRPWVSNRNAYEPRWPT